MSSPVLPVFSSDKLKIWFVQVESVFRLNSIEADDEMYDHIVANIPAEYTILVEDIITNPPANDCYKYIKKELLKRMSEYNMKKVDFSSDKPSKYLQQLHKIGDELVSEEYVINKWLSLLPQPVREIVVLETSGDLQILGEMADKIMALLNPTPLQNKALLSPDQFDVIQHQIEELKKDVKHLQLRFDGEE